MAKNQAPKVNPLKMRKSTGMTQDKFWNRIGISQSGGSRYEGGRRVPGAVRSCLLIAHGDAKQAADEYGRLRGIV